jgi:proline utilization trans-activator
MSNSGSNNPNHVYKAEMGPNPGHGDPFAFTAAPYASSSSLSSGVADRRPLPNFDVHKGVPTTPVPSNIQSAAQRRESAKARRRVPTSQRKRTKLSCDACKAKRCKCLRTGPTPDSDDTQDDSHLAPCKNCVDAGIECVTTLPRKQRIYGSVEQLDRRYRALDALVSGLFPDLPSDATPEELVEYGRQRGVAMPDLGTESDAPKSPTTSSLNITSPSSPPNAGRRIGDDSPELGHNNTHFIRDASGRTYYIGPWGSLGSFARVRNLIARRLNASTDPDASRRGQRLSSKSVTDAIARSFGETSTNIVSPSPQAPYFSQSSLGNIQAPLNDTISTGESRFWVATSKIKLPDKKVADMCVNAFFDNVHPDFMLFHRPSFQQDYEELWNQSGRRPSVPHLSPDKYVSVGWLCCLYLVFILGSRSLSHKSWALSFQRTWYESVKELPPLLIMSTLPNVCALMLLALYYQGTNDRTKSWVYLGAASRLAVALGMHRECANEGMNQIITEIRKRVWWTLYDYEQHLCCSLGRPSSIEDTEVNVDEPDERVLQCVPAMPREQLGVWVQLIRMQAAIRREIHVPNLSATSVIPQAVRLLRQLGAWRRDLPSSLLPPSRELAGADPQRWRRIMLLHVQYQKIINLLTRRFLLHEVEVIDRGESLGHDAYIIVSLGKVCVTSAMRCAQLLVEIWRARMFNGVTALDTYYAYLCSIQICLRLLEPSHTTPDENPQGVRSSENWKFEAHKPRVEPSELQVRGDLDFELEAVIAQMNFAEQYSAAQLTDIIRQIHDLLKTVPMSGFSAKCEAIASEFAKAVGAVDGKPESTLFGGRMGQDMHNVAQRMNEAPHLSQSMVLPNAPLFSNPMPPVAMEALGKPQQPFQQTPMSSGAGGGSNNVMDCVYSGILAPAPNSTGGTQALHEPPQIQWDMIQPPEEWSDRNRMFTDMAADSMSWPFQEDYQYNPMNPPP